MGLARRLGVSRDTIRRWLESGWLSTRRDADGHHVIWADAAELRRLRQLRRALRDGVGGPHLEMLKRPKPHPAR
jgi:DNA-binding transcriptional MerR regulator